MADHRAAVTLEDAKQLVPAFGAIHMKQHHLMLAHAREDALKAAFPCQIDILLAQSLLHLAGNHVFQNSNEAIIMIIQRLTADARLFADHANGDLIH